MTHTKDQVTKQASIEAGAVGAKAPHEPCRDCKYNGQCNRDECASYFLQLRAQLLADYPELKKSFNKTKDQVTKQAITEYLMGEVEAVGAFWRIGINAEGHLVLTNQTNCVVTVRVEVGAGPFDATILKADNATMRFRRRIQALVEDGLDSMMDDGLKVVEGRGFWMVQGAWGAVPVTVLMA